MIVDDEPIIREKLKQEVDYSKMNIEIVGEAGDSLAAMSLFIAERPNIVVMDINIPYENGLIVSEKILDIEPETKIIVITGYDDFHHAKEAIKYGVTDYISKPMIMDEYETSLRKICDKLIEIQQEKMKVESLDRFVCENIEMLREKCIFELLHSDEPVNEANIKEQFKYLKIDLEDDFYNVAVINLFSIISSQKERQVSMATLKNLVDEEFKRNHLKMLSYFLSWNKLYIVFSYGKSAYSSNIELIFVRISERVKFFINLQLLIGIGTPTNSLGNIADSYKKAVDALNYVDLYGYKSIVNAKDIYNIEKKNSIDFSKNIDTLISFLRLDNIEKSNEEISQIFSSMILQYSDNIELFKVFLIELVANVSRIFNEMQSSYGNTRGQLQTYQEIIHFESITELYDWVLVFFTDTFHRISECRKTRPNKLISSAQDYINRFYNDSSFNLSMVGEYIGLSSSYLSQLFFKQTNKYFSEYLNEVRVDKAKSMLTNSTMKVYEIAYAVGYNDPKYFNLMFKKIVGQTPNEYRNSIA